MVCMSNYVSRLLEMPAVGPFCLENEAPVHRRELETLLGLVIKSLLTPCGPSGWESCHALLTSSTSAPAPLTLTQLHLPSVLILFFPSF